MDRSVTSRQRPRSSCPLWPRGRLRNPGQLRRPRWPRGRQCTNIRSGPVSGGRSLWRNQVHRTVRAMPRFRTEHYARLAKAALEAHDLFRDIVLNGALASRGMERFGDVPAGRRTHPRCRRSCDIGDLAAHDLCMAPMERTSGNRPPGARHRDVRVASSWQLMAPFGHSTNKH